ncbi:MAG: alanine--tRNA ligase, partial [Pseudomonadota bacterium]|nr:alanine--tRNA ligase [Pseudomonadota bacterium]
DLDNVGYTARHHTFFEMLGNFSFGDYFKEGAIELAWTLITKEFQLPVDKLLVTVYHDDDEAFGLWKKIAGFHDDRIIRIATSDNFWSMGDTGPCGPCSEIFYDQGEALAGGPPGSLEEDGDRFLEFWNLVFMQFDQGPDGRAALPKPSIDTGMGLERIAALMQGVHSNYDTDLFKTLIAASVEATGVKAEGDAQPSHRVIADHLRTSGFLVADGVSPSNEGRGYVLRRIMRRAMRHAHLLGTQEPLMHRLVPTLVAEMGGAYPELKRAEPVIVETLRQEEERFRRTLGRGSILLDEATAGLQPGQAMPGDIAFKLYDTYGFPLDLTQDALRAKGLEVDLEGFDTAMERQRASGRENWAGSGDQAAGGDWLAARAKHGGTAFEGYENVEVTARALSLTKGGEELAEAEAGDTVQVLFDRTPFYAESGGQASDDRGEVEWAGGGRATLVGITRQAGDLVVHTLIIDSGTLKHGAEVRLEIDSERRLATRANHSAAHLVHKALSNVLGPHVAQKGQMVDAERMRFDFSHGGPLTTDELDRIEAEVNAVIRQNVPAETKLMAPQQAIEAGAIALFGEKYGDEVRVLTLGRALDGRGPYSVELCGGTHVARTGDIALFRIVSETGVAAGVRRVEALTGEAARRYMLEQSGVAQALAGQFKVPVLDVTARVEGLTNDKKRLEREVADLKRKLALGGGSGGAAAEAEVVNGIRFMGRVLDGVDGKGLRPVIEDFRKQADVVVIVGVNEGKAAVAIASASAAHSASDLIKVAVAAMGGQGGGGKADFAQGGAPDGSKAQAGVDAVKAALGS